MRQSRAHPRATGRRPAGEAYGPGASRRTSPTARLRVLGTGGHTCVCHGGVHAVRVGGILAELPYIEALLRALAAQVQVGDAIEPSQLGAPSPCPGWSVRDVMNHSLGVTLKFVDFASGATDHPDPPPGDLVGTDHGAGLRAAAEAAHVAWVTTNSARRCHLPFATFSADLAAGCNLVDALAHTWDIASATGVDLECPDELWEIGLEAARAVIGAERDLRHYAPVVLVGCRATARSRFLGFVGRVDTTSG